MYNGYKPKKGKKQRRKLVYMYKFNRENNTHNHVVRRNAWGRHIPVDVFCE